MTSPTGSSAADRIALDVYLSEVREIRKSGLGSDERSFYPAIRKLLSSVGARLDPKLAAVSDPAGTGGSFPDLSIYEQFSRVLVLPVEVKPADRSVDQLLALEQASRYAETFGGGLAILTNIRQFVLARRTSDGMESLVQIDIVAPEDLDSSKPEVLASDANLGSLLAFGAEPRATLTSPPQVAQHLAEHSRAMVDLINDAGDVTDLLAPVWQLFESGLGTELDREFFVPSVVQTLTYGMFAAWLTSEDSADEFDWQSAAYQVEVPLFADVLHASLRPKLIRKCNLLPRLGAIAAVLRRVDRDAFTDQIGDGAIEYFYEPFLAHFDETLRDRLGVWYTPREIAAYQAARCNFHLKVDLDETEGLASSGVIILDPAVGTGTYLAQVYEAIYQSHLDNGEPPSVAAERLKEAALTRVIGFEILPAAFIIAHLHLALTLRRLGVQLTDTDRLRVYLTNSLTGWDPKHGSPSMVLFPELEEELEAARAVKQHEPVMVILGNPPYEGYSTAVSGEERELIAPWIEPLWSEWHIKKHRLNDLYARFWKAALNRVELTGHGIVSFISNRQWLTGRSYPAMRADILASFDRVVVDDLHGDVHDRTHAGDQSVFTTRIASGVKVGIAVVTATRFSAHEDDAARVQRRDLRGSAEAKRDRLVHLAGAPDEDLIDVDVSKKYRWRMSGDIGTDYPFLDDYFHVNDAGESYFSGVQTVRDEAVLAFDRSELETRMADYFDPELDWEELAAKHPGFAIPKARYDPPKVRASLLASGTFMPARVVRYLHRPMDPRWLYWEPNFKLLNEARRQMIPYWAGLDGQRALVAPQTRRRSGAARPLVASQVPGFACVDPDARVFPMVRPGVAIGHDETQLGEGKAPDPVTAIGAQWVAAARERGAAGTDSEIGEMIFYALAGVAASQEWLATQDLRSGDLPSVPVPGEPSDLDAAAAVGRAYAELIDPDLPVVGVDSGIIRSDLQGIATPDSVGATPLLELGSHGNRGGRREGNDLLWDTTHGWRGIPETVWNYELGGFQPLTKWLSYRVGLPLSSSDREHVMHLVRRLHALHLLSIGEANKAYERAHADPLLA